MKLGTAQIPSNNDMVVITDIGFEPKVFSAWCANGSQFEFTYDDYTNNIHSYGMRQNGNMYAFNARTRITAKSSTSLSWDSPVSALRGQTMYYSAIG